MTSKVSPREMSLRTRLLFEEGCICWVQAGVGIPSNLQPRYPVGEVSISVHRCIETESVPFARAQNEWPWSRVEPPGKLVWSAGTGTQTYPQERGCLPWQEPHSRRRLQTTEFPGKKSLSLLRRQSLRRKLPHRLLQIQQRKQRKVSLY